MLDDVLKKLSIDKADVDDSDKDGCYIYEIPSSNIYSRLYTQLDKNFKEDVDRANITTNSSTNFYIDDDGTSIQLNADMENNLYKLIIRE